MGFRLDIYNWPPVHTSWGEKKWVPGQLFITIPLFTFPEARDKRDPGLHICDQTPVYILRSVPRYKNQQQK